MADRHSIAHACIHMICLLVHAHSERTCHAYRLFFNLLQNLLLLRRYLRNFFGLDEGATLLYFHRLLCSGGRFEIIGYYWSSLRTVNPVPFLDTPINLSA